MINLYPAQMRALAAMCEALDAIEEKAVFRRLGGVGTGMSKEDAEWIS